MNRKVTILLVAAIAAILPAVAVADVLITGQLDLNGTQNTAVWKLLPGPNKEDADGYVGWAPDSTGPGMGDLHLNAITNQQLLAINVMKIVFDVGSASGYFTLNLTGATTQGYFPDGSYLYLNLSETQYSDFQSPYSYSSPYPDIIALPLHLNSGQTVTSGPIAVDSSTVIYIGFYVPGAGPTALNAEVMATGMFTTA